MQNKFNFKGIMESKMGAYITVNISLIQFEDSGSQVIYAPALEVYGYGINTKEARGSFEECLLEFIDYTISKGTLNTELKRLGWKIKGKKSNRSYTIPDFSHLLRNNKRLIDLMNEKEIRTYKADIPMAISA